MTAETPVSQPTKAELKVYGICRQMTTEALKVFYSENVFCGADHLCRSKEAKMGLVEWKLLELSQHAGKPSRIPRAVGLIYEHLVTEMRYAVDDMNIWDPVFAATVQKIFPAIKKVAFFKQTDFDTMDLLLDIGGIQISHGRDWPSIQAQLEAAIRERLQAMVDVGGNVPGWIEFEFEFSIPTRLLLSMMTPGLSKDSMADVVQHWVTKNVNAVWRGRGIEDLTLDERTLGEY
jgi:hypothetical protein